MRLGPPTDPDLLRKIEEAETLDELCDLHATVLRDGHFSAGEYSGFSANSISALSIILRKIIAKATGQ